MVKKLFKHEFLAWLRVMAVVYAVILTVAGAHRIFQFFENDSTAYTVINILAIVIFSLSVLICVCIPTFFSMNRFYKNLFTGEGYLSFTLPVTAGNHLWVKALTATAMSLLTILVCCLAGMIITAGDVFSEVLKAAAYLLRQIPKDSVAHLIGYCAEILVLVVVSVFAGHMVYNTCICIGQLFRKNRVVAAVGVYFAYYYICQILGVVFSAVMAELEEKGVLEPVYTFVENQAYATLHIGFGGLVLLEIIVSAICFAVCHHIISRKLNLE